MSQMIADRILSLREEKKLTQEELSELLEIDRTTLSRYEKGTTPPPLEVLIRLSDFFNVSIDWIVGKQTKGAYIDWELAERLGTISLRIRNQKLRMEFQRYLLEHASTAATTFAHIEKCLEKDN